MKDISEKELLSKIDKELLKINKKANNLIKKWTKDLNRHLIKQDVQVAEKHLKRCSTSYVIKEMQIKITMRCRYRRISMAKIQNTDNIKYCWASRATGTVINCWWACKTVQPLQKTV